MKINILFFLVFVTIPGLVINKNNQIVKREEIGVESQSSKSVSAEETASSTKWISATSPSNMYQAI